MFHNSFTLFLMVSIALFCVRCKTAKLEDNLKLMESSECIVVGGGGGFTGQMVDYFILENGSIIKVNSISDEKEQLPNKLKKQQFAQFKSQLTNLLHENIGSPGNYSQYIGIRNGDETVRCIWEKGNETDQTLASLHKSIMHLITQK